MHQSPLGTRLESDLYELLQVSPRAKLEVIQAAYRVLARSYHPDVSSDPDALQRMRQLNAAYDVLTDPNRRAEYDAHRAQCARAGLGKPADGSRSSGHRLGRSTALPPEHRGASPVARIMVTAV